MADNFNEEMGHIGNPQFMGQQLGNVSIEKIRALIKRQKRLKGYSYEVPAGTSSFDLNLSGTARLLLGIVLLAKNTFNEETEEISCACGFASVSSIQFTVNNEIVIDTCNPNFLSYKLNTNEYYYIPRPLSGTDQLTLKFINTGGRTEEVQVLLYYI